MRGNNFLNNKKGFTLAEVLVVVGLFVLLGFLIVNVYLLSLQSQRSTSFRQDSVSELRFVTETIAQKIRISEINYPITQSPQVPVNELSLLDTQGKIWRYYLDNGEVMVDYDGQVSNVTNRSKVTVFRFLFYISPVTDPFAQQRCNDDNDCLDALSSCTVDDSANPFLSGFCTCDGSIQPSNQCGAPGNSIGGTQRCDAAENLCLPFNQQPRVTMLFGFESAGPRASEKKQVFMQTTVSSRIYKR